MITLEEKINMVKSDILSRFPGCPHTISITLWDDNTDSVECRYGDGSRIYISRYYNNELTYNDLDRPDNTYAVVDENGQDKTMYLVDKI